MKWIGVLACLLAIAGCSPTVKMAYVDAGGKHGSGTVTMDGTLHNGKLSISDDGQTCAGTFPHWSNLNLVVPVQCTGGVTGTATMTRVMDGPISGEGTMQLSNGETKRFVYNSVGEP
ncbi:hypothetical protein NKH61_05350 [Mesorhizobium sp. M1005]|uniref:hypothetical protein n=1 Tax=unclassified Mesorhizobium TaxID=325217 RepID=UPI00333D05D3